MQCKEGKRSGSPGEKRAGDIREAEVEVGEIGIPKVAGGGRDRGNLRNIVHYFAIEKKCKEAGTNPDNREGTDVSSVSQ